jgi:dipeptidyl aminopeptidase/acylaminoacyl peptidase
MTNSVWSGMLTRFVLRPTLVGILAACAGITMAEPSLRPLTAGDAFATARFMPSGRRQDELISFSPDGRRYVIRLVRGDPRKHGLWVDVLSGSLNSLKEAVPSTVAHLFSTGRGVQPWGGPAADSQAWQSPITWIDDNTVAFLFSDEREIRQLVTVNLLSKQTAFETHAPTQIHSFDLARNGTVLYLADSPLPPKQSPPTGGFVVPDKTDALSLAEGYLDGSSVDSRAAHDVWFVQARHHSPERISFGGRADSGGYALGQRTNVSPDGMRALLTAPAQTVPAEWDGYLGHFEGYDHSLPRNEFNAAHADPMGTEAGDIRQLYLVDVASRSAKPLWNAVAPFGNWQSSWSSDGRYVVVRPIPIPIAEQSEIRRGLQTAIFDLTTGAHWILSEAAAKNARVTWIDDQEFAIEDPDKGERRACYSLTKSGWLPETCRDPVATAAIRAAVTVKVTQDLSTPPKLVAVDEGSGEEQVVLDPNPRLLSTFTLGKVEHLDGSLSTGEHWTASLTLPINYVPGRPYPLVIQCQGGVVPADQFSLYGLAGTVGISAGESGLGPSLVSVYAAQVLAGRGIAVLEFNTAAKTSSPAEAETTQRAFEELARSMIVKGIADEHRIGITGFSRNGYYVSHALSHSTMRFAAAVVADNVDYSYMQVVLSNHYADAASAIGAPAFGAGLKTWLDRSTGFNVDVIHAPILLIGQSGGGMQGYILGEWEILGRLRELHRPVEMYLMPEIDTHPSHNPQNPDQVIAVQERTVDWFDFWLNGHEMSGVDKTTQYARWRLLRQQQEVAAGINVSRNEGTS